MYIYMYIYMYIIFLISKNFQDVKKLSPWLI